MISNSTPSIGSSLAKQGIRAMFSDSVSGGQEQGQIGKSYLESIRDSADLSSEKSVARVAESVCGQVNTWRAQVAVAEVAMNTIAGGVVGPLGSVIAQVGKKAMFSGHLQDGKDQGTIGSQFVAGVARESDNELEQILAKTATKASGWVETWRGQVAVADSTLSALADGVSGEAGTVLASVGYKALYSEHISTIQDQAKVALTFTQAVAANSTDPAQKARAEASLKSADRVSTAESQVAVLGGFLQSDAKLHQ